jgi:hypothetical protein
MAKKQWQSERTAKTVEEFQQLLFDNLYHTHGQAVQSASRHDGYTTL